jgi:hypothetical protein
MASESTAPETEAEETSRPLAWRGVAVSAIVTVVALFGVQEAYRYATAGSLVSLEGEVGAEVAALKQAQRAAIETGAMPIERAMKLLADRGRMASPMVAPEASTDPGPAAGWMHHPSYEPPPAPPAAEETAPGTETETEAEAGTETETGTAPEAGTEAETEAEPAVPSRRDPAAPPDGAEPAAPIRRPTPAQSPAGAEPAAPTKRAPAARRPAGAEPTPPTKRAPPAQPPAAPAP